METTTLNYTAADFKSNQEVKWCPGCGDYSILATIQRTMPKLGIAKEKIVFVSGIGCSSRFPYYMNTYGFHTIHGRAPTFATGIKLANPDLSVWMVTGDGDALSIGGNHFIHALRRNIDIKILLFNNEIYGLTKGQVSPASATGTKSKTSPEGSLDRPIHPVRLALASGATFVARTIDRDPKHMADVFEKAAAHKGTAFIEIYQNCVIFNDGIFDHLTNKETKSNDVIFLENGKPLLFNNSTKGLRINSNLSLEIVDVSEATLPTILVHDEDSKNPLIWELYAQLSERHDMPTPVGIFKKELIITHEENIIARINNDITRLDKGNLEKSLNSGDTWQVSK